MFIAPLDHSLWFMDFFAAADAHAVLTFPNPLASTPPLLKLTECIGAATYYMRTRIVLHAQEAYTKQADCPTRRAFMRHARAFLSAHQPLASALAGDIHDTLGTFVSPLSNAMRLLPDPDDFSRIEVHSHFIDRGMTPRARLVESMQARGRWPLSQLILSKDFQSAVTLYRAQSTHWKEAARSYCSDFAFFDPPLPASATVETHSILFTTLVRINAAHMLITRSTGPAIQYAVACYVATHLPLAQHMLTVGTGADAELESAHEPRLPLTTLQVYYPRDDACAHEGDLPKHGAGFGFVPLFYERGMKHEFPWCHILGKLTRKVCQARKLPQVLVNHTKDPHFFRYLINVAETAFLGLYSHAKVRPSPARAMEVVAFMDAARRGVPNALAAIDATLRTVDNAFITMLREHLVWQIQTQAPVARRLLDDIGWEHFETNAFSDMDTRVRASIEKHGVHSLVGMDLGPDAVRPSFSWEHPVVYRTRATDFVESTTKLLQQLARHRVQLHDRHPHTPEGAVPEGVDAAKWAVRRVRAFPLDAELSRARELYHYITTLDLREAIDVAPLRYFGGTAATVVLLMRLQQKFVEHASDDAVRTEIASLPNDQLDLLLYFFKHLADLQSITVIEIDDADFVSAQLQALCRRHRVDSVAELPHGAGELILTPSARKINCQLASGGQPEKFGSSMVYLDVFTGQLVEIVKAGTVDAKNVIVVQALGRIIELDGYSLRNSDKGEGAGGGRRGAGGAGAGAGAAAAGGADRPRAAYLAAARAEFTSYVTPSPSAAMALILAPCCGQWCQFNVAHCLSAAPYYECGHCDFNAAYRRVAPRCASCHQRVWMVTDTKRADAPPWQRVRVTRQTDDGLFRIVELNICPLCARPWLSHVTGPVDEAEYFAAFTDRSRVESFRWG